MPFRLSGLPLDPFRPLFGLSDDALESRGVRRLSAEPSFPCRVTLDDAELGEPVLLLHFEHQPPPSPYRASGPIFVRERARETLSLERIPDSFRPRLFSARAYDSAGMMIEAEVAEGTGLERMIERLLADPAAAYLHLHHARRGCYACRVDRA
jgi:hypothetical protein